MATQVYSPLGSASAMPATGGAAAPSAQRYPLADINEFPTSIEQKHADQASNQPTHHRRKSSASEWFHTHNTNRNRGLFFWIFGALNGVVWTVALFGHAVRSARWVYCYAFGCVYGSSNYAATTLGWNVLAFSLFGLLLGFIIAFKLSDRSVNAWFRLRDRPAQSHDIESQSKPNPNPKASHVEALISPRSHRTSNDLVKSVTIAFIPFMLFFAIIGIWFGFQIGAVASILKYNGGMDKWAFSICLFTMMGTLFIFTILSWIDKLTFLLSKLDTALVPWATNDGLAPLGILLAGFGRGIAISGYFALLGVLIGTCIGLPAVYLGGVALAIILLVIVIIIIAIVYFKKRGQTPPSSPRHAATANPNVAPNMNAPPPATGPDGLQLHDVSISPADNNVPVTTAPVTATSAGAPMSPVVRSGNTPRPVGSPHNGGGGIEITTGGPSSTIGGDGEVIYLRGLALLHNTGDQPRDPFTAQQLIKQAAQMGYPPAQEHMRKLNNNTNYNNTATSPTTQAPNGAVVVVSSQPSLPPSYDSHSDLM